LSWKKSVEFVRQAPVFGHGTGTIKALFERAAAGKTGAAGVAAANPHNQTFAIAIQLGLVGAAILWAMWIAHMLLFRGDGLAEWIGLVIVVQNVVGSLFNSHLFDFTQGWLYVVGVGVAGGMVLKNRRLATSDKAG
jgi:O-antigen ligase